MLTITFFVTLDSEYVAQDGRTFGLLGKKVSHFITADGASLTATTSVEFVDGADYRGDAIAGKKGERFVYFGLEQSGAWLRRRPSQTRSPFPSCWGKTLRRLSRLQHDAHCECKF
jgi:hypothetical protein